MRLGRQTATPHFLRVAGYQQLTQIIITVWYGIPYLVKEQKDVKQSKKQRNADNKRHPDIYASVLLWVDISVWGNTFV